MTSIPPAAQELARVFDPSEGIAPRATALERRLGWIYFVGVGDESPVKIGFSESVETRVAQLQTAHWNDIDVLGVIRGSRSLETQVHTRLADARVRGEWFAREAALDVLEFLRSRPVPAAKLAAVPEAYPRDPFDPQKPVPRIGGNPA